MSNFHFAKAADEDILEIAIHSIEIWGLKQSKKYKKELDICFQFLAENPDIGRDASIFALDLKRYSYKAHAIFFKTVDDGIFIVRVLGQKMDLEREFLKL